MQAEPNAIRLGVIHVALHVNDRLASDGCEHQLRFRCDPVRNHHPAVSPTLMVMGRAPPPELVLDPRSGRGVGKVECAQQYDFHGIATTAEAHWENGLAERHHAILANMFEKLNEPSAIFVACDASQKCLKATVNTGSVLRRSTFGTCLDDSVHAACRQLALVLLPLAWIQAMMLRRRP